MNKVVLFGMLVVLAGCSQAQRDSQLSDEALRPPKGAPLAQVEQVYGKAERVLPPDLKQPKELHVYSVLPRLLLRVNYDDKKHVVWSEFLHLDAKYYPISAKQKPTPEELEHDRKLKERDLNELRAKTKKVPWST